jgi:hypothetical protein
MDGGPFPGHIHPDRLQSKYPARSLVFFSGAQQVFHVSFLMCPEFQSKCLLEAGSNGRYDRASGSIRSTQTRRHFANLTGNLCDCSRWKSLA